MNSPPVLTNIRLTPLCSLQHSLLHWHGFHHCFYVFPPDYLGAYFFFLQTHPDRVHFLPTFKLTKTESEDGGTDVSFRNPGYK